MRRKLRPRQHVIAERATNHVERVALDCGFSVEQVVHDYGLDQLLFTYDEHGETEPGHVWIQVEAKTRARVLADGQGIAVAISRSHLARWLAEPMPVILVVHDILADVAYWEYVQAHFERRSGFVLERAGQTVTIRVPTANRLDAAAIRRFARFRDDILVQTRRVLRHHG